MKRKISIIVSFYNEEENINEFITRVINSFKKLNHIDYELIFIDDYSNDLSNALIKKASIKNKKLSARGLEARLLNAVTPTKPTWNGHNSSGWKEEILAVNGFDERMQYGGEDRELGERLFNKGIKSKQIRYSAVCVHLDHARGYVKEEMLIKNAEIRKETKAQQKTYTAFGIKKDS